MLVFQDITKRFGRVLANDSISFEVPQSEIHALVGQNGAGKTTLISCLSGLVTPDEGKIFWHGEALQVKGPHQAVAQGIGVIHQNVTLDPGLTVAENIVIGAESSSPFGWIKWRQAKSEIEKLIKKLGLNISLEEEVENLSLSQQRAVEILRLLWHRANLIILDEPTSNLGPQEIEGLFNALKQLKETGVTTLLITHRLREVMTIADRVTVLRQGQHIATGAIEDFPLNRLRELMFGKAALKTLPNHNLHPSIPIPKKEGAADIVLSFRRPDQAKPCAINIGKDEAVGIIALPGNGLEELAEAVVGRHAFAELAIVAENGLRLQMIKQHRQAGINVVPAKQIATSLALEMTVSENIAIGRETSFTRRVLGLPLLFYKGLEKRFGELVDVFRIIADSPRQPLRELSGGNRQRLLLARELDKDPRLLILEHPCQGLDETAGKELQSRIKQQLAAQDKRLSGILILSHDLDEVLEMADRVLVMYRGEIVHEFWTESIDNSELEKIGLYLSTGKEE